MRNADDMGYTLGELLDAALGEDFQYKDFLTAEEQCKWLGIKSICMEDCGEDYASHLTLENNEWNIAHILGFIIGCGRDWKKFLSVLIQEDCDHLYIWKLDPELFSAEEIEIMEKASNLVFQGMIEAR